jgi:hypothetical protein
MNLIGEFVASMEKSGYQRNEVPGLIEKYYRSKEEHNDKV